jgi:valyl-tRNA synthetase
MESGEYDHRRVEAAARALWEERDVYRHDPDGAGHAFRGRSFSVDTPPPYVSAAHLHVGHAMSYSQPDFIVRYRRMRGERVFYPIGFDDNGLPTERYVEKKYGVRAGGSGEGRWVGRAEFVRLCLEETQRVAADYEDLWRRLGLSVDWSQRYSTIDERSRRTAQLSFVRMHRAGHVRRRSDPILWCPEDRTALAQADVEDLERTSKLYRIEFPGAAIGGTARRLSVATTRPELLPACVAVYHHPEDPRYAGLSKATVPLFGYEVPAGTDPDVDPEYGTGLMMVCTFGDSEDVVKWRRDRLPLRLVVTGDGRLGELAGEFAGLQLTQARAAIVRKLGLEGTLVKQVVGVHERCQTPVEFQIRPQWFVGVREHADRFRARAAELEWIPPFMRRRLDDWIDGLKWDWNITRQRHYGVPFPVWFCVSCGEPVLAAEDSLPVDPLADAPPVSACPSCGSGELAGDPDVMDTWMTSSLTPQIALGWDGEPMSMRVQGFEIIRTWLFYTIVQSELHFGRLPWHTALISGWGLNEQGRKISKRDLDRHTGSDGYNRYVPDDVVARYGADALRIWAAKGRIGSDLRYTEKDVRTGRKLAVKLWNVGRFLSLNGAADTVVPVGERTVTDRWVLSHLAEAVAAATEAFEAHDYALAYQVTSRMFWSVFCDRYIEMIKDRLAPGTLMGAETTGGADADAARCTLREAFRVLLGLFAPFAPFVTEELYQRHYAAEEHAADEGGGSLHRTSWPASDAAWVSPADREAGDALATILDAVRALRSELRLGNSARLRELVVDARTPAAGALLAVTGEALRLAARADALVTGAADHPSGVDGITIGVV